MKRFLRSLQFRIIWIYVTISIAIICMFGTVLYVGISRVVMDDAVQSSQMAISKSASFVEMYVDRLKVLSTMLSHNPQTIASLISPNQMNEQAVMQLIDTALVSDPYIKSVVIISKDGYVLSNERELNMQRSSDMMNEPWYVAAIHSTSPVLTSARMQKFSMDKDNWVISLSQEVKDENGNNLGVVLIDIEYEGIEDHLDDLELGNEGFAYIINDQGDIVYHKDPSYFTEESKKEQLREISRFQDGYDKSQQLLIYKAGLSNTDWTLVGVNSLDGLQQVGYQLVRTLIFVGLGLVLLTILLAPVVAKSITRPIQRLIQAMEKMKKGSLDVRVSETGVTEVQDLAQHFNTMVREIRRLMQDIEAKEKTLHAYELSVLHSQINPHFLYNTLDMIVWMAEFNESERVISVTKTLAKFFQLSLNGGSEHTTIENEISHVTQYLIIQKDRYGEKLNYVIDYDPTLSKKVIPKIILQPIVENAIYHGIREKDGPGLIEMTCHKTEDGNVLFTIRDDGVGFNPHREQCHGVVEASHHTVENKGERSTFSLPKLGGVGINNVDNRIKLTYGQSYGISIKSNPGEGTEVTILLP